MQKELKLYQKLLLIIILPLCLLIFVSYGWIAYSTITNRPGINGTWYLYLQLSKNQFVIYNLILSCFAFGFTISIIKYLLTKQSLFLTRIFWTFLIFIVLLIICEIYLQTRFQGKA
jgi:hypothetical protein